MLRDQRSAAPGAAAKRSPLQRGPSSLAAMAASAADQPSLSPSPGSASAAPSVHLLVSSDFHVPSSMIGSTSVLQTNYGHGIANNCEGRPRGRLVRLPSTASIDTVSSVSLVAATTNPATTVVSTFHERTPIETANATRGAVRAAWIPPSLDTTDQPETEPGSDPADNCFFITQQRPVASPPPRDAPGRADVESHGPTPVVSTPNMMHTICSNPTTTTKPSPPEPQLTEPPVPIEPVPKRSLYDDVSAPVVSVRSQLERDASPEKLNLNRKSLYVCPPLPFEEQLRLLNYQNNLITRIENMDNLCNLGFLDFYNNQIEKIQGLDRLVNLRVLMLGRNRISCIEGLDALNRLDVLDLHSNQICVIENLSHLSELRVLNLEDNLIEHVPTLVNLKHLGEVNLKKNRITRFDINTHLRQLKRILLSDNKITSFDDIANVFDITSVVELTMDQNRVCDMDHYRHIVISRAKGIKLLDGRRVLDEEKRLAVKLAKRDSERRRELERRSTLAEERKKCIAHIHQLWDRESALITAGSNAEYSHGSCTSGDKTIMLSSQYSILTNQFKDAYTSSKTNESKSAYVELEGSVLNIYGNGAAVLDRIDITMITSLQLSLVSYDKLDAVLSKLDLFQALECVMIGSTNMRRLKQLCLIAQVRHLRVLDIADENPITKVSMFRPFAICVMPDHLERLCGVAIRSRERDEARTKFGHLRPIVQDALTSGAFLSQKASTGQHQLATRSAIRSWVDYSVEMSEKRRIVCALWNRMITQTCTKAIDKSTDSDTMMAELGAIAARQYETTK